MEIFPSTLHISITSFIRFRHLRKVDLPQPDGPIRAVTLFFKKLREILLMACLSP